MTSFKQWQANRSNARKSTGPTTEEGKAQSRRNALRHGLTAETVIGALEDAEDYKAFEAAIIADYDAQSAVERELVLRLASALWRLRRATAIETGLFEIQAEHLSGFGNRASSIPPRETSSMPCSDRLIRQATAAMQLRRQPEPQQNSCPASVRRPKNQPPTPASTLRNAFCASPICRTTPSTGSAAMNTCCGAKWPRSSSRSTI